MLPAVAVPIVHPWHSAKEAYDVTVVPSDRTMEDFLDEAGRLFQSPLHHDALLAASARFVETYKSKLHDPGAMCMLPSYNHTLPTGDEKGVYLAMDVGGSTFRIALVELRGKSFGEDCMRIIKMTTYKIDEQVRRLRGRAFFDWMADRMQQTLEDPDVEPYHQSRALSVGLAWSFPIKQTSERGGDLAEMGKGFDATHGVEGHDLAKLIMEPCRQRKLRVHLDSIVNDSAATLLTRAYRDTTTRLALIVGTGTNAAIQLPVGALAPEKYGKRPRSWHEKAERVLVNTEMSMFGKGILHTTRWDNQLNNSMPDKWRDFQPLEQLVSGRNMGEIMRLAIVEAVDEYDLFDSQMPSGMDKPWNFDCTLMATLEADKTRLLNDSHIAMQAAHPLPPSSPYTPQNLAQLRRLSLFISQRGAAYLAIAIHALWTLRLAEEGLSPTDDDHVTIACNGSVIEKYPSFRAKTQQHLDALCVSSGGHSGSIRLEVAWDSAIFGAAIGASCLERRHRHQNAG